MSRARRTMRAALWPAVVIAVAVLTLLTALTATGQFGLVIAADCLTALGLIVLVVRVPRGAPESVAGRAPAWGWLRRAWFRRRPARQSVVQTSDFPTYTKISSDLSWAPVSEWHYDHGIRPLFGRLVVSALAEHHRVDAVADPERARHLVGDEIWPLVDPSRPPSFDSRSPGADLRTLARIVDRLEQI
jgi:hypothetical protein